MSGKRRGFVATFLRASLWLAQFPYRLAVGIRNRRFDRGAVPIHSCGVPVISVGNVTTGGTGKTPIVCCLAERIRAMDRRVAIVSRGYGRGDQDHNDEAEELFARLPDVPHVQDADRVQAARIAVEELASEVILMDDGFQHRHLHRDLDIVVIDATCPFGYGFLLPRGLLREPLSSLRRADMVLISRCGLAQSNEIAQIEKVIEERTQHRDASVPIVHSDHRPTSLLRHPDEVTSISQLTGKRVITLCAIGNPAAFESSVAGLGAQIVQSIRFPDHDPFDPNTMRDLSDRLSRFTGVAGEDTSEAPPDMIVCTHKDLVKLKCDRLAGIPLAAVLIEAVITQGEAALSGLLKKTVASLHPDIPQLDPLTQQDESTEG